MFAERSIWGLRDSLAWHCTPYLLQIQTVYCGPGSSVDIATELRAGRSGIESRWRRDFPPVQTGPGAHPALCKMGTGSFPGVEAAGAWGRPPIPSRVNKQRNILHEIRKRKANWIGHILRRNCLQQQVIEGKIKGQIEVTRRRGRRRKKLLDDLKDRRGYCQLKEEALDRTVWRNCFGRGFGPVV